MSHQFHAARIRSPKAKAAAPAYIPTAPGSALAIKSDFQAAVERAPVLVKETFAQLPPLSEAHGRSGALRAEGYAGFHQYAAADVPYGPGNYPQMTTGATDAATGGAVTAVATALDLIAYDGKDALKLSGGKRGQFDAGLLDEVKKFQKWAGFSTALVDGIVGPLTYAKLKEKLPAVAAPALVTSLTGSAAPEKKDVVVVGPGPKETVSLDAAKDMNAPFYAKSWFPYAAAGGLVLVVGAVVLWPRKQA